MIEIACEGSQLGYFLFGLLFGMPVAFLISIVIINISRRRSDD